MGAGPRDPSAKRLIAIRSMTDQRARRIIGGLQEPHQTETLRAYTADPPRWLQQNGLLPMGYHVYVGKGPFLDLRHHSSHDTLEAAMRTAETISIAMSEDRDF